MGFNARLAAAPQWRLTLYHRDKSTPVSLYKGVPELLESVAWLAHTPEPSLESKAGAHAKSQFEALFQIPVLKDAVVRNFQEKAVALSLSRFMAKPAAPPPLAGLETEYARHVHATIDGAPPLKYEQKIGSIDTTDGRQLARVKLDGISKSKSAAIIELEFRPFTIGSAEYKQQIQIKDNFKSAIAQAAPGSVVTDVLASALRESTEYKFKSTDNVKLAFGDAAENVGPHTQFTLELPLRRFGDVEDTLIPKLMNSEAEIALLQHARRAASDLVEFLRPIAAEFHGGLYAAESIKFGKLRGYFTQCIVQACQAERYGEKKYTGFHIRLAGPKYLGFRDKDVLERAFGVYARGSDDFREMRSLFETRLRQALTEGGALLPLRREIKSDDDPMRWNVHAIMSEPREFEPRGLEFKNARSDLKTDYGNTLVEFRQVHGALNHGIATGDAESIELVKSAQTKPAQARKKTPI